MYTTKAHTTSSCQLFDGFALGIQALLGTLALTSLLLKRYNEQPRREPIIWFFDVSKQAMGSSIIHLLNIVVSIFSGGEESHTQNPCVWYLLNLLLDTTLGVGVLYLVLKMLHRVLDRHGYKALVKSGYYGKPPLVSVWLGQFAVFLSGLIIMKILVVIILATFPLIARFGRFVLSPLEQLEDPRYQIIFVMLLVPLIMNVVQFWLTDHIIKAQDDGYNIDPQEFAADPVPLLGSTRSSSPSSSSPPLHPYENASTALLANHYDDSPTISPPY